MPFTIQPLEQDTQIRPFGTALDPAVRSLTTFDYSPERAWRQAAATNVRGSIAGGPSLSRFMEFGNEQRYLPVAPRPALTAAVLPDTAAFYRRQLGAVDFAAIDPYSTLDQGADQAQQAVGGDPFAAVRGIQDFLAAKDIDLFGVGSSGAPSRAADYALALPLTVLGKLTGNQNLVSSISGLIPRGGAAKPEDDVYYRLHADPRYWQAIIRADPKQLAQLARDFASKFVDPGVNAYAVEQLTAQLTRDRQLALGQTSGNDRTDYLAKQNLARQMEGGLVRANLGSFIAGVGRQATGISGQELLSIIPFVGTQLAQAIDPVSPEVEEVWQSLTPEDRAGRLNEAGLKAMATDVIASLPAFGGLGTVMEVARAGTGMAKVLATSYDALLRASAWTAGAGLTMAVTNWGLSAYSPEYAETIGKEVDLARPISGSFLAGEVNQIGYFATGTWGAYGVARTSSRILSRALKPGLSHVIQGIGLPETPLYQYALGGARVSDALAAAGFSTSSLRLSAIRMHLSYMDHLMRKPLINVHEAIAKGAKVLGLPELEELTIAERLNWSSEELMASLPGAHAKAIAGFKILSAAAKPAALFISEQGRRAENLVKSLARTIHDDMARMVFDDYGAEWVARQVGEVSEDAIRAEVRARVERLGRDFSALEGRIKGEEQWTQTLRAVHQLEFDTKNAELDAVMADRPGVPPTREAGRVALVTADHLWLDTADEAIAAIRASSDVKASRAIIRNLINSTREAEGWYVRNFRPRGFGRAVIKDMDSVNPESFVRWLEEVRPALLRRRMRVHEGAATADLPLNAFHSKLVDEGLWEIAFKPTDDAGRFVSYVHTTDELGRPHTFQTPWLDYPVSNVDNIEIGNRGRLMAKYDAVFRGFRTWRVVEFQRGLLYRNLTGGKYRLDVTPAQIEAFHKDVMSLASEYAVQPQTLGAVGEGPIGIGRAWKERINATAAKHFGDGAVPVRGGGRVEVDWSKVIADSYRQSLKLNFTAGLTSYMKAHFGAAGSAIALWSDIGYINFRFGLSPVFKLGEVEETIHLNALAGVNPHGDPWVEQLFARQGVGENHGIMTQEQTYDQMLIGTGRQAAPDRVATGYGFLSLRAPETLAQKQAKAVLQAKVEAHQQFVAGGNAVFASPRHSLEVELASLTDDAGNILPGMDDRADEISRILTGELRYDEVRAKNQVGAEFPDATWTTDPMELGTNLGYGTHGGVRTPPDWLDPDSLPEDRGLWHATTDVDSVHSLGLRSGYELERMGKGAKGLGGGGSYVSTTTDWVHADTIRERLLMATQAARNETTNRELLDYWLTLYDEMGMDPEVAFENLRSHVAYAASKIKTGAKTDAGVVSISTGRQKAVLAAQNEQELVAAMDQFLATGQGKYELVRAADSWLEHATSGESFQRYNSVILVSDWERVALADPRKIGIVQVGVKKGADYTPGPDTFEVQIASKDLWVLDRRILDQPLATDREGLLAQLRATLREDGQTVLPGMDAYHDDVVKALAAIDNERFPPGGVADNLGDVPGTPEFLINNINELDPTILTPVKNEQRSFLRRAISTGRNPIPFKQHQALLYRIEKLRRDFPALIRASGLTGFEDVMHQLKVPERNWLPFLMEDRELAQRFSSSGHPDDLAKLLAHGGDDAAARGKFDELYASEDWATITGLWSLADRAAADDAFRVHFFNPYRSALERSLNHPLIGIYPLSWALKAAREWTKFLYDNHTFAGLRLGMTPAVALNQIVRAQNAAFAMSNDEKLEDFIGLKGPLGSAALIFNLILPGDWSSIPFPASRTIRDLLRKGPYDTALGLPDQVGRIGLGRDARLLVESMGEIGELITPRLGGSPAPMPWEPLTGPQPVGLGGLEHR